jgi:hypothetical protein
VFLKFVGGTNKGSCLLNLYLIIIRRFGILDSISLGSLTELNSYNPLMIHIFTIDLCVACIEVSSLSFCLPQLGTMLLYIFAKV